MSKRAWMSHEVTEHLINQMDAAHRGEGWEAPPQTDEDEDEEEEEEDEDEDEEDDEEVARPIHGAPATTSDSEGMWLVAAFGVVWAAIIIGGFVVAPLMNKRIL